VFANLKDVERGDQIVVTRADDSSAVFRVTRTEQFDKSEFPTELVYGNIDHPGLRVITCDGMDSESGTYEENLVVFAELERART
jgi:sortase (surface protein transpeptidase)